MANVVIAGIGQQRSASGRVHSRNGGDRFVLKDGKVIEGHVIFGSARVREALSLAAAAE